MTSTEIRTHIRTKKMQEEAKELTARLINLCNVMGNDQQEAITKGIAEAMKSEHRTIQQSFVSNLHNAIIMYSTTSTDLRNEGAVQWAKDITNNIKVNFPYI